ncbi:MAG: alpha-L-glutamate ligase-like protein [Micavibrio sp.]|nr:MAG: alpha-L-glutamate ligase-like protein [Micavibrio sp.]
MNFSLKKQGVLGMNSRNLDYIFSANDRRLYPLVDDKLNTKILAEENGIKMPKTYGIISYQDEIKKLAEMLEGYEEFVVKPAKGSGGGGILVVTGRTKEKSGEKFLRAGGQEISPAALRYHIGNILGGLYALGGVRDRAIIEQRVDNIPLFRSLSGQGVPDIRLLVYRGVPVMGMLRLPTVKSRGRANLHTGGVGIGFCLKTGVTTQALWKNRYVTHHPDTRRQLSGLKIPQWRAVMETAAKAGEMTGLGYLGADIVIDRRHGPMLLELNARPGIAIQTANRTGLKPRLEAVDRDLHLLKTAEDKITYAAENFTAE